jgi:Zinc carboxypeptidase
MWLIITCMYDSLHYAAADPFAGSSADWSRGAAQIKYPYLTELRDASGDYAFVPPPSEIIPCGEENWAGFKVLLQEIVDKHGNGPPRS